MNESGIAVGIPDVILRGGPEERGALHGTHLREKIEGVVDFYGDYIGMREADVFVAARHFKTIVEEYSSEYGREITALADGAGIDPLWIFAVNARSEIVQFGQNECTAIFFPQTGLLGQTWDWFAASEDLTAVVQIELPNDHTIVMMTEPGIIGKIGLNSAGLGVCLNYLIDPEIRRGLPIHILMRAILDSGSLVEAKHCMDAAGTGRSGNLLIGAADGGALAVEFRTAASYELPADGEVYLHTNHYRYRGCDLRTGTPKQRENTRQRLARAEVLVSAFRDYSTDEMLELLSDCKDSEHPIYAPYREYEGIGTIGTICTLMMDLPAKRLSLRHGNGSANAFVDYQL
jgi:isopenicillin-N N-acyltransferase-like protein